MLWQEDAGSLFSSYTSAHCGRVSPNQRHPQRPGAVAGTTEQEAEPEGNEPALLPDQPGEFPLECDQGFLCLVPKFAQRQWALLGSVRPNEMLTGMAGPRTWPGSARAPPLLPTSMARGLSTRLGREPAAGLGPAGTLLGAAVRGLAAP